MDGEIKSFLKVWISALASLCYCYFISRKIPKGKIRLFSLFPIFYLFLVLPLGLSSFHLGGPTAFYLAWLGNFKLLLFAFDQGPLSSDPLKSLPLFISIASLPIKIQNKETPSPQNTTKVPKSLLILAVKAFFLVLIIRTYDYKQYLHPNIILALYCCHMYLGIEIALALSAALARTMLALELEPQFNEPYLSTSLQDFWGRRWNLMVTSILRPTIYDPIRCISTRILGSRFALLPAVLATFAVSGLMHELIFYYLTRVDPTWEVTWFFVLHGICTAMEIVVKKALAGRFQLHPVVSGPLTVGFVAVSGVWLFFPQILRNGVDTRAIGEYGILFHFLNDKLGLHGA
ncbi:hypothetical protein HHK36_005736 [Tetracentron sinense]|uniref:Wax synthase domain-containing protein n=1 Tax=Tetracentron sinense TaxID=13715 RepID=A0A834ZQW8_TETSI|nr:hypothetical protein HHK36_005736 [Tetracentron sinense]